MIAGYRPRAIFVDDPADYTYTPAGWHADLFRDWDGLLTFTPHSSHRRPWEMLTGWGDYAPWMLDAWQQRARKVAEDWWRAFCQRVEQDKAFERLAVRMAQQKGFAKTAFGVDFETRSSAPLDVREFYTRSVVLNASAMQRAWEGAAVQAMLGTQTTTVANPARYWGEAPDAETIFKDMAAMFDTLPKWVDEHQTKPWEGTRTGRYRKD